MTVTGTFTGRTFYDYLSALRLDPDLGRLPDSESGGLREAIEGAYKAIDVERYGLEDVTFDVEIEIDDDRSVKVTIRPAKPTVDKPAPWVPSTSF